MSIEIHPIHGIPEVVPGDDLATLIVDGLGVSQIELVDRDVVVITHNAALAQVADRIVHLRSGEITEIKENTTPIAPEEVVW